MQQAIHIFKKDVRQFWYEIAVVLGLTLLFAFTAAQPWSALQSRAEPRNALSSLLAGLLPIVWWYLIARLIHSEALPGDRQFWLTRPYDRNSLLGAKVLFVAVFVNLPLLIVQAALVSIDGFPLASNLGGLLWEQVLVTAVFVFPAMAIASVTKNIAQFGMSVLTLIAGGVFLSGWLAGYRFGSPGPIEWLRDSGAIGAVVVIGSVILFLQFMHRRTSLSRGLAVGGVIVGILAYAFAPWAPMFAFQSRLGQPFHGSLQVTLDRSPNLHYSTGEMVAYTPRDRRSILLPFLVSAPPETDELTYEAAVVRLEDSSNIKPMSASISPKPAGFVARITVDRAFFERVHNQPIRVHTTLYLTEFGNQRSTTIPLRETAANVPGVGQCFSGPDYMQRDILCRSVFRWPARLVSAQVRGNYVASFTRSISYSPFPATLLVDPVESFWASSYTASELGPVGGTAPTEAKIITKEPLSYFRYDFDTPDVILQNFAVPEGKRLPPR